MLLPTYVKGWYHYSQVCKVKDWIKKYLCQTDKYRYYRLTEGNHIDTQLRTFLLYIP